MMGNLAGLLRQLQEAQKRAPELRDQLAGERVEVSAGGGLVTIVANGLGEISEIHIDGEKLGLDDDALETLEDAILAAARQVAEEAREKGQSMVEELTGGMLPPGLGL